MSKNKNKIRIRFIGKNADDVTGSCVLIEMPKCKILLEFGLYQSSNIRNAYKINSRKLEFKPPDIDYIFINHAHIDHIGGLPRLYANGCEAKVIAPKGTSALFSIMGVDSAYILAKDAELIRRKYKTSAQPIYSADDVATSLEYFEEYDMQELIKLNDAISFRFVPSGHIIGSCQLELWLTNNGRTSKILYTSDLGNISVQKYYSNKFEPVLKSNIAIVESTYTAKGYSVKQKDREKDLEKIKSVIITTCVENRHKTLIPVFSLDRAQNILTHLYDLFGQDRDFNIPIIIDSPLTTKLFMLYPTLLSGDDLEKFNQVMKWKNIKFLGDYVESKSWQNNKEPLVCLSASGFMNAGRSRQWVKALLPDAQNHILFVGYSSPDSLAGKIKNCKNQKTISIDGKSFANRCGITNLTSFTSHIQYSDMLTYYSNIKAEKICLVHGDFASKCEFAKELQNEISRKNQTTKVVVVNKTSELVI